MSQDLQERSDGAQESPPSGLGVGFDPSEQTKGRRGWVAVAAVVLVAIAIAIIAPRPAFMQREHVQKSDYETMEFVFDQSPLPSSFQITGVDYRGYSLLFNGPDGAMYSNYEVKMDASDYDMMKARLLQFQEDDPLASKARSAVRSFNEPLRREMWENESGFESFDIERFKPGHEMTRSAVLVDKRSTSTIVLYVRTRAYLGY